MWPTPITAVRLRIGCGNGNDLFLIYILARRLHLKFCREKL